jgi:hypothetical protein
MKQTAVEWLQDTWLNYPDLCSYDKIQEWFKQAKEMEKEQIGKAFFQGRLKEIGSNVLFDLQPLIDTYNDYYNETFKSE